MHQLQCTEVAAGLCICNGTHTSCAPLLALPSPHPSPFTPLQQEVVRALLRELQGQTELIFEPVLGTKASKAGSIHALTSSPSGRHLGDDVQGFDDMKSALLACINNSMGSSQGHPEDPCKAYGLGEWLHE